MVINESKTKIMLFNPARKIDILPKIELNEVNSIEVVDETKLLGLIVRSDLKWQRTTDNIIKKAIQECGFCATLRGMGQRSNSW